jgi:hypothetical protein
MGEAIRALLTPRTGLILGALPQKGDGSVQAAGDRAPAVDGGAIDPLELEPSSQERSSPKGHVSRGAHPLGGIDRVIPDRGMPGEWRGPTFRDGLLSCGPLHRRRNPCNE